MKLTCRTCGKVTRHESRLVVLPKPRVIHLLRTGPVIVREVGETRCTVCGAIYGEGKRGFFDQIKTR
jgi:hypothetical protein